MAYKRHKFPRTSRTLGQQMVKPRHWAKRVCFGLENLHLLSFLLEGHGNPKLTWTHRAIEPWLTSITRYVSMIFNDVQWFSMCVPRIKKIKCSWLLAFKMNLALNCHELPHLCRLLCNCQSACCPWRTSLCHRVLVIWWQFIKLWGKCDMPMATTCYNKGCCGKTLCPNKSWEIWCILSATGSRIMPLAEGSLVCGSGCPPHYVPVTKARCRATRISALQNLARLSNASHSKGSRQLFISDLLGQHTWASVSDSKSAKSWNLTCMLFLNDACMNRASESFWVLDAK